ncbi:MAG TPA: IPT/TIG domain-containing protein [Vicinamibacterales bacterium]
MSSHRFASIGSFFALFLATTLSAQSNSFMVDKPLTSQGVFSCTDLTMSGSAVADSSGLANPTPSNQSSLRSNGNVRISGGTVHGDATAGPGKSVQLSGSGTVTGTASSATTAANCTPIDLAALASALQNTNDNATVPLSTQHKNPLGGSTHTDFTLSGGDSLTLHAGTYYFSKISLSGGATLHIDGLVRILCTGRVDITGGSFFNSDVSPYDLRLWVSGTPFNLSSSTLGGIVYAPAAAATVSAGTLKGSLFANQVTLSGSAHVTRVLDDIAPRVSILSPADGSLATASTVTVTGIAADDQTAVSLTVNGQPVSVAADGSFQVPVSIAGLSPATITAIATDAAGNIQSASVTLAVSRPTISSIAPAKGPTSGGTSVTITGTNFTTSSDTSVRIGGAPATQVTVTSSTTLTARVPASAPGAADVVVTTFAGSATLSGAFTYFAPPVIASFSPSSGGPGTAVTISGQNFDPDPTGDHVTFGALPATVLSATATQIVASVPVGAANGPITIATAGGSATSGTPFVVASYARLEITTPVVTVDRGTSLQLNAIGVTQSGHGDDVTSKAAWSSSGTGSVSNGGVFTASAAGSAQVNASFSGFTAVVTLTVRDVTLPADPAAFAPQLAPTIAPPLADEIRFLYTGASAIQTGVAAGAINDDRVTVLRGLVKTLDGQPIAGVKVTIVNHPEYGQTLSRSDGMYDFVINGGAALTLRLEKSGFIEAQRRVITQWGEQKHITDVALVAYDSRATGIALGAAAIQVAQANPVTDKDGTRQGTIVVPAGTNASLVMPDGTSQPVSELHIRATEYSVGPNGPLAMPAQLPPSTSYTYCVELSADEAVQAGAQTVQFSSPLSYYVDNFIGFPVGTIVPAGYYDRQKAAWIPMPNGVVLKILSITNGLVDIDADGNNTPATSARLAALGITDDERRTLATLYAAGRTLWRVPIAHFTPYDFNWTHSLDAPDSDVGAVTASATATSCNSCTKHGSIIDIQNQSLGEAIAIAGTPYTLNYSSRASRVYGSQAHVKLSGPSFNVRPDAITLQNRHRRTAFRTDLRSTAEPHIRLPVGRGRCVWTASHRIARCKGQGRIPIQ